MPPGWLTGEKDHLGLSVAINYEDHVVLFFFSFTRFCNSQALLRNFKCRERLRTFNSPTADYSFKHYDHFRAYWIYLYIRSNPSCALQCHIQLCVIHKLQLWINCFDFDHQQNQKSKIRDGTIKWTDTE